MATQNITLGYWQIRGLAEPIRTLLEYLEIPYEMKDYTAYEAWLEKKNDKSMTFPNLPYLADGDKTITESNAILAHACLKANKREMLAKPEDKAEFLQLQGIIGDFLASVMRNVYGSKSHDEIKEKLEPYMASWGKYKLDGLNDILGKREWVMGYLTTLDFALAEAVERFTEMDKEVGTKTVSDYPNLQAHLKRFLELPKVQAYRQSNRFRARPHNGPSAAWS